MSGNLCGYVVCGQRPVTDAAITIVEGAGRHVDLAPVTDADGWFALDDLPAGKWLLRATSSDGASGEASVYVWDDSLSELTISLDAPDVRRPDTSREGDAGTSSAQPRYGFGSVSGCVTDAVTGRPVRDVMVVLTDGPGPMHDDVVRTDSEGNFTIPVMEPGDWFLRAISREGGHGELVVAVLSGRRVRVEISLIPGSTAEE